MSLHALLLAGKITGLSIAGLWAVGFLIAGVRRAIDGPHTPEEIDIAFIAKYEGQAEIEGWIHRMLVVFDIFLNVLFLRGQQDETMSAHAWRASLEGKTWGRVMNYWLCLFQPQHGPKAAIGDLIRATHRVATNKKALGII